MAPRPPRVAAPVRDASTTPSDSRHAPDVHAAAAADPRCTAADPALPTIPAGFAQDADDGCSTLDPAAVLRATPRSFALRVRGQSMVGAGIFDGDIVVGNFTPQARPGAIVVALIDGEVTLKRLLIRNGQPQLVSENPNHPRLIPLHDLVVQGVVHTVVHRLT